MKKIPTGSHAPTDFLTGNYCDSMFFSPTTTEEVMDIINNLKNSNSTGVDNISVKLIKACGSILSPILSHINNHSLVSGIFPDALKIAKVVPVFKNGDAKCISNYRPISVLPTISKITEKIVFNRLSKYLTDHSILHSNQFGFREKLSTSMALLELIDKLTEAADNKLTSIGVFIDLAKAFDTVNHKILLCKLEHYGIRGIPLSWFHSYLTNRKQFVVINKFSSDCAQITCGVPQGSILGPILFLLYINDLNSASKVLQTIMFADDTNLFLTGKSLDTLEEQMNEELQIISEWFKANLLSLNITKTSYMIFGNNKFRDLNLMIEHSSILRQFETKFLGVILAANLKWSKHIEIVLNKISKSIGILSKVRYLVPSNLTRMLYLSLVEPYLNYCNLVRASSSNTVILNKILNIQKRFCRLMTFSNYLAHSKPLFIQLFILPIYEIYKYNLAIYMFRIINRLIPPLNHHQFVLNSSIHHHYTRRRNDIHTRYCRTTKRQNTFAFQGPKLWRDLPTHLTVVKSLPIFKKSVKLYLVNNLI